MSRLTIPKEILTGILDVEFGLDVLCWDVAPDGEFLGVTVTGGDSDTLEQLASYKGTV